MSAAGIQSVASIGGEGGLYSYRFRINYSNYDDADTSESLSFFTLPAGAQVVAVNVVMVTAFAGPGLGVATVSVLMGSYTVGSATDSGDFNAIGAAGDTNQASLMSQDAGTAYGTNDSFYCASATPMTADLTTSGCNINALTAGAFDVILTYSLPVEYPVAIA